MMGKQIHILIVEDNAHIAQLLEAILSANPSVFTFSSAKTVAKGIKCLRVKEIDLILLDLNLPDSSGLDTLETIRAENLGVPIVVLSGMADKEIATQAFERGAQDYLIKGRINCDLLYRSIHRVLERCALQKLDPS